MPKVVLSMPEKFLNDVDNIAKKESRTRSELIREALRSYIYKGLTATQAKQQRIEKRPYSAPERHRVRGKNSLKKIYVILRAKPERIKLLEK